MRVLAPLLAAGLGACAPSTSTLLEADAARSGDLGTDGPLGATLIQRPLRVRGDRVVDVDVIAATDVDGDLVKGATPVLLVQGGAVPVARYHWLAQHLASRGAVVVAPHFLGDLAFFDQADASDALRALRQRSADGDDVLAGTVDDELSALAIGHSLGGVVAAGAFESDVEIGALALLASYPDPASTPTRRDGRAVLVVGEQDGLVDPAEVVTGAEALQTTTTTASIAGLTHFQITDDATDAERDREGTTGDALEVVRPRLLFLIDALFATLDGGDARVLDTPTVWPAGVDVLDSSDDSNSEGGAQ